MANALTTISVAAVLACTALVLAIVAGHSVNAAETFTGSWAVEIRSGDPKTADKIAKYLGFVNLGKVTTIII